MTNHRLLATCPLYLEELLEQEVLALGGRVTRRGLGCLAFQAPLEGIYNFCLSSRVASHLLLELFEVDLAESLGPLYEACREYPWKEVMNPADGLGKMGFVCQSQLKKGAPHSPPALALKVKDGIVDYWRDLKGERPPVDRKNPRHAIHIRQWEPGRVQVYTSLNGRSLSRRGYRLNPYQAALRETSAAAVLLRAGWDKMASPQSCLVDPLCGAGTLLIEGALLAGNMAVNLHRGDFAFLHWPRHNQDLWESCVDRAEEGWHDGLRKLPPLIGYDRDPKAVEAARENVKNCGLEGVVHLEKRDLADFTLTKEMREAPRGLIVSNPPYGQRLEERDTLFSLYRALGDLGKEEAFHGWQMTLLSHSLPLLKATSLVVRKKHSIRNGPLECQLFHYDLSPPRQSPRPPATLDSPSLSFEGQEFLNRLKKKKRHLKKWRNREGVSSYRLYDADLPNFNMAIDVYEDRWVQVQEYRPPQGIDPAKAKRRLEEAVTLLVSLLDVPRRNIFLKERFRQKGTERYTPLGQAGERYLIKEWGQRLWVNFTDYLDTGIFLDHRNIRRYLLENSQGKRVLNLFAYTCTASVMAAAGGAFQVVSVDTSRTYLQWGEDNFKLNNLQGKAWTFERQDAFSFLAAQGGGFDLIFIDPPTFSNSKSSREDFDIQRDHPRLLSLGMTKLNPRGLLIFSSNCKGFNLDPGLQKAYQTREVSSWTQSEDFKKRGHRSWFLSSLKD